MNYPNPIPAPEGEELNTPATAREWFTSNGIAVKEWCRECGINRNSAASLLTQGGVGVRGNAFKAAVALRLRPAPSFVPNQSRDSKAG